MQTKTKLDLPKKAVSTPVILAAVIVLPISAYLCFWPQSRGSTVNPKSLEPSTLFDESTGCSRADTPLDRAHESEEAATARIQRYPFFAQDGVTAVRLYAEAERCYLDAGQKTGAQRIRDRLAFWKHRINQDYQSARLRLRLALENRRYTDALFELESLKALLAHRGDAYTAWLDNLERELTINNTNGNASNRK